MKVTLSSIACASCLTLLVGLASSLRMEAQTLPFTEISQKALVSIDRWRVTGPFKILSDTEEARYTTSLEKRVFNHDYLKQIGGSERPLKLADHVTENPITFDHNTMDGNAKTPSTYQFIDQVVSLPYETLSTQQVYWGMPPKFAMTYASTNLISSRTIKKTLIVSSNSPMKIWLNDRMISAPRPGSVGHVWAGLYILHVHLRAGTNRLLIKMLTFPQRNDFALRVASRAGTERFLMENAMTLDPLDNLFIKPGGELSLSPNVDDVASRRHIVRVDVIDRYGSVVYTALVDLKRTHTLRLTGLPDGLYDIRVHMKRKQTMVETFYMGALTKFVAKYAAKCVGHDLGLKSLDQCSLLQAISGMTEMPQETERLDREKPLILLMSQLVWSLRGETVTSKYQLGDSHLFTQAYLSNVDGTRQYYYIHLPPQYSAGRPVPLVVVCPYKALGGKAAYGGGPPTQIALEFERYVYFADKYGLAIVMPFALGRGMSSKAGIRDVLQVVDNVEMKYRIDRSHVELFGDCAGGRGALLLAEGYPNRFDAVGTINAATGSVTAQDYDSEESSGDESFDDDDDGLMANLPALAHTPILLVHGTYYPHSPAKQASGFKTACLESGVQVQVQFVAGDGKFDAQDPVDIIFSFFSGKARKVLSANR